MDVWQPGDPVENAPDLVPLRSVLACEERVISPPYIFNQFGTLIVAQFVLQQVDYDGFVCGFGKFENGIWEPPTSGHPGGGVSYWHVEVSSTPPSTVCDPAYQTELESLGWNVISLYIPLIGFSGNLQFGKTLTITTGEEHEGNLVDIPYVCFKPDTTARINGIYQIPFAQAPVQDVWYDFPAPFVGRCRYTRYGDRTTDEHWFYLNYNVLYRRVWRIQQPVPIDPAKAGGMTNLIALALAGGLLACSGANRDYERKR